MKPKLTKQELNITRLIASGFSAKEIPDKLPVKSNGEPITLKTVQNTLYNIYQKLGINKANELATYYYVKYKGVECSDCPSRLKRLLASILLVILLPSIYTATVVRTSRASRTANSVRPGARTRQDNNLLTLEYYG